mgnify:CR=1 FL=1
MILLSGETETLRFAEDVALVLGPGDCLCLCGDLGAGKSTLARAIVRCLSGDDALEVPSPTFTLVQSYETTRGPLAHFDLYRLADAGELEETGFADALTRGIVVVEWPERAEAAMPDGALWLQLEIAEGGAARTVSIAGDTPWQTRLARSFAVRRLLSEAGYATAARRPLQGDASSRSYERIRADGRSMVLMNWPAPPPAPPLADGRSYADVAHVQSTPAAFLAVAHTLADRGFVAPRLVAGSAADRLMLLTDLGGEGLLDEAGRPLPERYVAAAEVLADLHEENWPRRVDLGDVFNDGVPLAHELPDYDEGALETELGLYLDWWIPHVTGRPATEDERAAFHEAFAPLVADLRAAEQSWTLRDVHSPNLIWQPGERGRRRVGLIDVQDAMVGPAAYDLASLVYDARVDIDAALQHDMIAAYAAQRGRSMDDAEMRRFMHAFRMSAIQRNVKILGGFARLARRDGKPGYLTHVPRILGYLDRVMGEPVLPALSLWYERQTSLLPETSLPF